MNKEALIKYIDTNVADEVVEISHKVWEYAELSLKEVKSAALFVEKLKEHGFAVETGQAGIETAFTGTYVSGNGKPVIGILGEFDALSGLSQKACVSDREELVKNGPGHGCGHNMLGAAAYGSALAVKEYLEKTGADGTVIFYGCPGEEGGASKAFMAREGVWKELDCALTWHPSSCNEVTTGTCNSCTQVLYKFKGVAAHAAGDPENGRSALDAVELMNIGVNYLREHMKSECRVHYAMVDGGGFSPNVVQPHASVLYMVRAISVKDTLELQERVDKCAEGAALMTGTTYDRIFVDGTANTVPNTTLEKVLYSNMQAVPLPEYTKEETEYIKALDATCPAADDVAGRGAKYDAAIREEVLKLTEKGSKPINDFTKSLEDRLVKGESRDSVMKDYNAKGPALQEQAQKAMLDFIAKHPDSEGAAAFIPELGDLDAMKKAAASLSDNVRNGRMHDYYQKAIDEVQQQADAEAEAAKKQAAGVVAPDFTLNDLNGKPLALSSLKGKYVVLDFWGTWCVWCVRGIPKMKEYYNKYKGKFEILSIDCNDTQEKWKAGVKKYELPWLHVYQPAKGDVQTTELYAIQGFPTKILIGPDGKIIKTYVGEDPSFYTFLDKTFGK